MTGLVDLGNAAGVVDMGNAGITGVVDMVNRDAGVTTVSLDAFDTLLNLDTGNDSLLEASGLTTQHQDIIDGVQRLCVLRTQMA